MHRIVTWTARRLVLAGCCLLTSCGDGNSPVGILIELKNVPPRVERLQVSGTLDGQPAISDVSDLATSGLSRFGITVPATARGSLDIRLKLFDADGCTQGSASLRTPLPIARGTSLTASIAQQAPRQCEPLLPCADRTLLQQAKAQSTRLLRVWALSSTDVWAVGDSSTVLHWDGSSWAVQATTIVPNLSLQGLWASAKNDVWVAGYQETPTRAGYIYHYDGSAWRTSYSGSIPIVSVFGLSKDELFAVGSSYPSGIVPGEFRRYTSSSGTWDWFNSGVNQSLTDVWASSSGNVWLVGYSGTLVHFNGASATTIPTGITGNIWAVHGYVTPSHQTILYAVGPDGLLLRYDGSVKLAPIAGSPAPILTNVFATPDAVYVTSYNGLIYKSLGLSDTFSAYGSSTDGLYSINLAPNGIGWVVGANGFQGYIDTRP